ncbi:MAG: AraC family transcriptional regulator [Sphingobacteriales bacterium]|jgi:AraC-like DNA-binding protein|nr:AraC family transcriptional regulator [Sphingobacteriales bacterium]
MLSFVDKWYEKLKPYLFKYKDGFFELPYLGNTPLLMIESFRRMPFIKHDDAKKKIVSKSPFVDADVQYHEIQEDLILMYSVLIIKTNVCFRSTYKKEIPNGHYCLTYITNLGDNNSSKRIINGEHLENSTFQLLKPSVKIRTYYFKDSNFQSFQLYFRESWLLDYLENNKENNEKLIDFVHSKNESFITTIEKNSFMPQFINAIREQLNLDFNQRDNSFLTDKSEEFLANFIKTSFSKTSTSQYYHISNNDRLMLDKVEKILIQHLNAKFPGIGHLSQQIGISETKLKYLFKNLHRKTLLQFYQEQKMLAAYKMLAEGDKKVTEVARHFGYTNVSKFSAMFKTYTSYLPSKVQHEHLDT